MNTNRFIANFVVFLHKAFYDSSILPSHCCKLCFCFSFVLLFFLHLVMLHFTFLVCVPVYYYSVAAAAATALWPTRDLHI